MRVPPHFSPKIFFLQNDSEGLEMDFKHNFIKCNILTSGPLTEQSPVVWSLSQTGHLRVRGKAFFSRHKVTL